MDSLLARAGTKEFQPPIPVQVSDNAGALLCKLAAKSINRDAGRATQFLRTRSSELVACKRGSRIVGLGTRILLFPHDLGSCNGLWRRSANEKHSTADRQGGIWYRKKRDFCPP